MGRKRAKSVRPSARSGGSVAQPQPAAEPLEPQRRMLTGADRLLTLGGALMLILLVFWLAPMLSLRRSQAFAQSLEQTLALLQKPESASLAAAFAHTGRSEAEIRAWLAPLDVLQMQVPEMLARQELQASGRGLVRYRQRDGTPALLSLWLLQQRSLDFRDRWKLANLCRPDRQARLAGESLLADLAAGRSAQGLAPNAPLTPVDLEAAAFELGLSKKAGKIKWQPLDVTAAPWKLRGTVDGKPFTIGLSEQPGGCACLIESFSAR